MKRLLFAAGFSISLIVLIILLTVFFESDDESPGGSPGSPGPGSPGSPGKGFTSKQLIVGSFAYISNPKSDGSSGYLTLNQNSNMNAWPVAIPPHFTHAKFDGDRIFKFRNPNTSDTYGYFVKNSTTNNIFLSFIDLGTFS